MAKTTEQELLEKILKALEDKSSKPTTTSTAASTKTGTYSPEGYAKEIADIQKINEEYENRLKNVELLTAEEEKQETIRKEGINYLKKIRDVYTDQVKNNRVLLEQGKISKKQFDESLTTLRNINTQLNEQLAIEKKIEQAQKKVEESSEKIAQSWKKITEEVKDFGKSITNFESRNITFASIGNVVKNFDRITASTAKATGAGKQYTNLIKSTQYDLTQLGVTLEDTGRIVADANNNLFAFSGKSNAVKEALVSQAAIFEKVGVSSGQYFKNINEINTTLGTTSVKANQIQEDLVGLATGLGMSVSDMNASLTSNLNRLSIYGKDTQNQFSKLQIYAKTTNVEMGTLTELTEKLSTFEGAGEFAGRLNAMAGMDLFDVTKLTTLQGNEKIQYIIEQVQQANFDLDDPNLMRAIVNASGMDAGTFRKLVNFSGDKLSAAIKNIEKEKKTGLGARAVAATDEEAKALATKQGVELAGADLLAGGDALSEYKNLNSAITNLQKDLGAKGAVGLALINLGGGLIMDLASAVKANTLALIANTGVSAVGTIGNINQAGGLGKFLGTGTAAAGAKNVGGLNQAGQAAYKAARAVGATPAAAKAAAVAAGGGAAGGAAGAAGAAGSAAVKETVFKRLSSFGGKLIGPIASFIFEYLNARSDMLGYVAEHKEGRLTKDDLEKKIGQRFIKGAGGVLGGIGGGVLGTALFTPLGVPWLGSILGGMAGNYLGGMVFEWLSKFGGVDSAVGKFILDTRFRDEMGSGPTPAVDRQVGTTGTKIEANKKALTGDDMYVPFDGRPVLRSAKGTFMGRKDDSVAFFTEPSFGNRSGGSNNNELAAAVMSLVKAMQTSNKEVVLKIDGNQIQRVSFNELTPRMSG